MRRGESNERTNLSCVCVCMHESISWISKTQKYRRTSLNYTMLRFVRTNEISFHDEWAMDDFSEKWMQLPISLFINSVSVLLFAVPILPLKFIMMCLICKHPWNNIEIGPFRCVSGFAKIMNFLWLRFRKNLNYASWHRLLWEKKISKRKYYSWTGLNEDPQMFNRKVARQRENIKKIK